MRKSRILFIDNDPDSLVANKIILEQAGFEVLFARDGKTGLEMTKHENPDLIVLDVILPDINGFSICRELKEDPKYSAIPIILFTGLGAKPGGYTENISMQHKADAFLEKPSTPQTILDKVNSLLIAKKPAAKEEEVTPKILLVDDDPDFLEATRQILAAHKYNVITAKDGEEGIAKAKYENPNLIILDVIMPGQDGYSVCYELRKYPQTRPIPIIMLTAIGQQLSKPEYGIEIAIDHLADDYIDKPVDIPTLLSKVEKHLLFR